MSNKSRHGPSLRLWLQSTSLLAVLAGYSVLLMIHQHVAAWQRIQAYRDAREQIVSSLVRRASSMQALRSALAGEPLALGLSAKIDSSGAETVSRGPELIREGQSEWLAGSASIDLLDGTRVQLLLEQNVTESVRLERLGFWLLVIAAGLSSLMTSALMRPVLRRGLVQPLQEFSQELAGFKAPPDPNNVIDLKQQPRELQPIAEAFNELQERLVDSWNRERSFADSVAHELRTPITLISGHSQRLLRQSALPEQAVGLHLIYKEAERMRSLVRDLLDLARSDSGRLSLKSIPIVVEDALLELFERLESKAEGRLKLGLDHSASAAAPIVLGDPDRLQQCLTALVDNALLYSDGPIWLSWSQTNDAEVRLHVSDEGPGVQHQERKRIFERFVRGTAGLKSPQRGTGIGLSMVMLLMQAMGGGVDVNDAAGGGADFQLKLPLLRASGQQP